MNLDILKNELLKIPLKNFDIQTSTIKRNSISATKFDVIIPHHEHVHRNLSDVYKIIDSSTLNDKIKSDSKKIFYNIAVAEAKVHNVDVEKVHFHEVGAIDSIIDIIGTAICIDYFKIEKVISSPLRIGSNAFTKTQHGEIPIPAPATAEILKNYPTKIVDLPYELTTPTGAAIVATLSKGTLLHEMVIENIGYGAGSLEIPKLPNLLRIFIGETYNQYNQEEVSIIETNIDDMNPQVYPRIIEKVLALGAHDAFITQVIMKKGRPGILLTVIVPNEKIDSIIEYIYANTTTIGLRMYAVQRKILHRESCEKDTTLGKIKCKSVVFNGVTKTFPEYEDCQIIAEKHNISIIEVQNILVNELNKK
jgi:uncharacterized protein (TIGR00299 family) protein